MTFIFRSGFIFAFGIVVCVFFSSRNEAFHSDAYFCSVQCFPETWLKITRGGDFVLAGKRTRSAFVFVIVGHNGRLLLEDSAVRRMEFHTFNPPFNFLFIMMMRFGGISVLWFLRTDKLIIVNRTLAELSILLFDGIYESFIASEIY